MHNVVLRKRGGLVKAFGGKHALLLPVRLQAVVMSYNKTVDQK